MKRYNCALSVDCVIFKGDSIVLIRRKKIPFKGMFALPGGHVEEKETIESACVRETKEETNLDVKKITPIGFYSDPKRDSTRGRSVSFAFLGEVSDFSIMKAGDDAKELELVKDWQNLDLAFDHKKIIEDALKKKKI